MKRRTIVLALLCTGITAGSVANAQQVEKLPRIGLIMASTPVATWQEAPTSKGFLKGLHDLGYEPGRNIIVEFRSADVEHTGLPPESFDAVVCVFGVFFLPDMPAAVAELWRLVRPGGMLAITVWGPGFLEPATTAFWDAVGAERPDLVGGFHPWTRVTDPAAVSRLFDQGGAAVPSVEAESGTHPLADPEDWWTMVLGTGYRATVQRLDPEAAGRVRTSSVEWLRRHEVRELEVNVIYARARKGAVS